MANVKGNTEAERKRALLQARHRKAGAARRKLVQSAEPVSYGVVALDPAVLLGTALLGTPQRFIGLRNEQGDDMLYPRKQLRAARQALKVFPDLTVYVDGDGLHFRWRGGLGGWNVPQAGPMQREVERWGKFCVRISGLHWGCRKVA